MGRFYRTVCTVEKYIAIVFLVISVLAICTSAILRTLDHPIAWGLDLALMMFTWSTFLGAEMAFRNKALVKVDMLVEIMPEKVQKILDVFVYLLIFASLLFLIYFGTKLAFVSRARVFPGATWLSYSWVTASIPVSMTLMLISTLKQISETCFQRSGKATEEEKGK